MNLVRFILLLLSIVSCTAKKDAKGIQETPKYLYGEFMIALGENANNKVQCVASFKKDEEELDQFGLGNSTSVLLDSFPLIFDSVIYPQYDTEIDTNYFLGKHTWHISNNGKAKQYHFESKAFKIISEIPTNIGKEDIEVKCNSLVSTDKVTLLISGDYTDNSETVFDIVPNNGYFTITKSILEKIEGSNLSMRFNLSSIKNIAPDDFLTTGGVLQATRVTKHYQFQLIR